MPHRTVSIAREVIVVTAVLFIAAWIRFNHIDGECLWLDELWHVELSTGRGSAHLRIPIDEVNRATPNFLSLDAAPPTSEIWRNMDWVLHPPLYHTLLRGWRAMLGDSPALWRGMSAVCALLMLPLLYAAARRQCGAGGAMLAATMFALAAAQIAQARDTRGYTLAAMVSTVVGLAVLRAPDSRRSAGWVAVAAVGLIALPFIHYFAVATVVGIGLYATWQMRGRLRWTIAAAAGVSLILFAVAWGPTVRQQLTYIPEMADPFLADRAVGQWLRLAERVASLPARLIADPPLPNVGLRTGLCALGLVLWATMFVVARRRPEGWVWLLPLIMTALLLAGLDAARSTLHLAYTRYALAASPAVFALGVAGGLSLIPRPGWRTTAAFAAVALAAVTVPWGYIFTPDCRPMLTSFRAEIAEGEPIIFASPDARGHSGQSVYLYCTAYADVFPRDVVIATKPVSPQLLAQFQSPTVWVLAADPSTIGSRVVPGARELRRIHSPDPDIGVCIQLELPRP